MSVGVDSVHQLDAVAPFKLLYPGPCIFDLLPALLLWQGFIGCWSCKVADSVVRESCRGCKVDDM